MNSFLFCLILFAFWYIGWAHETRDELCFHWLRLKLRLHLKLRWRLR